MSDNFLFGASTSSHQVEGGNRNDWTEWERRSAKRLALIALRRGSGQANRNLPDHVLGGYPDPLKEENYISGVACDHYNRFREDFDIAKSLGHTAHRFSIEWSRIEPEEGKFDEREIAHYRAVILALRERGIEPFLTLWHWTLPVWLAEKGGVLAGDFPKYFARYVGKVAGEFKNDVTFWMTLNEPEIVAGNAYLRGVWPPQKRSVVLYHRCITNLIRAHQAGFSAIKRVAPQSQVGIAINFCWFESAGGIVNDVLKRFADRVRNFHFLNHIRTSLDFIGCNYYFHSRIDWGFNKNKNESVSDLGWEIYPEGIYHVLNELKKYQLPIYITENGVADARDAKRGTFIAEHLLWMRKAMNEGADVRGYFHWSLLDNFEWDKGFWPRFGLVEVDYATLERRIRPSALACKKIIERWGGDGD
jgi:beta-glucosidase